MEYSIQDSSARKTRRLPRAGWVSMLLLESLRNAVQPPGSKDVLVAGLDPLLELALQDVLRAAAFSKGTEAGGKSQQGSVHLVKRVHR